MQVFRACGIICMTWVLMNGPRVFFFIFFVSPTRLRCSSPPPLSLYVFDGGIIAVLLGLSSAALFNCLEKIDEKYCCCTYSY